MMVSRVLTSYCMDPEELLVKGGLGLLLTDMFGGEPCTQAAEEIKGRSGLF